MYIRSVPISYTSKMRVSEMFVVGIMELNEYKNDVKEGSLYSYSDEYSQATLDELKEKLKDKSFKIKVQDQQVDMHITEIEDVRKAIQNRVVVG